MLSKLENREVLQMNACYQCHDQKFEEHKLENEDIFELCQKCGTAYYDSDQLQLKAQAEMNDLFQKWADKALSLFKSN